MTPSKVSPDPFRSSSSPHVVRLIRMVVLSSPIGRTNVCKYNKHFSHKYGSWHGVAYICVRVYRLTMSDDDTSIRIKTHTWRELKDRKQFPNQSFDDVIQELLEIAEEAEQGNRAAMATAD